MILEKVQISILEENGRRMNVLFTLVAGESMWLTYCYHGNKFEPSSHCISHCTSLSGQGHLREDRHDKKKHDKSDITATIIMIIEDYKTYFQKLYTIIVSLRTRSYSEYLYYFPKL